MSSTTAPDLSPAELKADALGSFLEAIRAISEWVRAGEPFERIGYFARSRPSDLVRAA